MLCLVMIFCIIIIGIVVGGIIGVILGIFRVYFGISEVIVIIMMNYIVFYLGNVIV